MRWTPGGRSADLEDRRGSGGGGRMIGGIPRLGIGGFILLLVLSFVFKKNLFTLLDPGAGSSGPATSSAPVPTTPEEEKLIGMVSDVLDDSQRTWEGVFASSNIPYQRAKLAIFTDSTQSGCGYGQAAMGPFYCPADQKVYIDLGFYKELQDRFGAPGDFAQAYVIAHEIGHHVQHQLGIDDKVRQAQSEDPSRANELSVLLELQADCLAGVWAHSTSQQADVQGDSDVALDPGDIDEGLAAAAAVGDDRIQQQATGRVNPESWTHGSSQQRAQWFRTGYQTGDIDSCNTFGSGG